jgi:tetratricopeptide (TPR) repeat protein
MRYSILFIFLLILTFAAHAQELPSADQYAQRGIARFQKNDLDGAIADFTKVIEMNGKDQEFCYYFRGMAQYRKGHPVDAINDLSKAIGIKPDPRFFDDRGNLLAKQGELDRAMADLNKAIEIAPQYAKAYGDRGLVKLLQGDSTSAEADFKRCFELDNKLQPEFKAAANQVKRAAASHFAHEKPTGVEITKFSWTEAPAKTLVPSEGSISVNTAPVSATGTRVLANPNDKGDPGPGPVLNPSGITTPPFQKTSEDSRSFIDYKFTVALKNTGNKIITAIKWAYFFEPKDPAHESLAYLFVSKTEISPGKEKTITNSLANAQAAHMKLPNKHNQALYNELVAILRLEYSDGTSWQSAADASNSQKPDAH